jgi:MtN3 and saliva related transmembrane protein
MTTELVGWISATILLLTLSRQVYTQWRQRSAVEVPRWLFIGQVAAAIGFIVYAGLIQNWVFVVASALILVAVIAGEVVALENRKREHWAGDGRYAGKTRVVRLSRREFRAGRSGYRR